MFLPHPNILCIPNDCVQKHTSYNPIWISLASSHEILSVLTTSNHLPKMTSTVYLLKLLSKVSAETRCTLCKMSLFQILSRNWRLSLSTEIELLCKFHATSSWGKKCSMTYQLSLQWASSTAGIDQNTGSDFFRAFRGGNSLSFEFPPQTVTNFVCF